MEFYPENFSIQISGLDQYRKLVEKDQIEVVKYFRNHLNECAKVLHMSYDKRYTPSTFIQENDGIYEVGWYSEGYHAIQKFEDFSLAISDFVLFSFGKERIFKNNQF